MAELFLQIINLSISASWLVLVVLVLRLVLRKAPRWTMVLLWGIVALRLIFPFSIESALSLIPSTETIPSHIMQQQAEAELYDTAMITIANNPILSDVIEVSAGTAEQTLRIDIALWSYIWAGIVICLLIYTAISYGQLRSRVSEAVILQDNIYQSEHIDEPFVLGIFRPKIYLPYQLDGKNTNHVIAHEQAHIRRRDHLWKPLGFLLLAVYWFNPMMWLAYALLCRDIELACDEKVIRELSNEERADYSQALVDCSAGRRTIAACPLAFGETGVKTRIKSVMNYKKPGVRIITAAIIVCMIVAICFLTVPKTRVRDLLEPGTAWVSEDSQLQFTVGDNYVIEGTFAPPENDNTISIGFRFAGKNAVFELFRGNWEYAQGAAEEPLLSGKISAKNRQLIFEVEQDNTGAGIRQIVFSSYPVPGIVKHAESVTVDRVTVSAQAADKLVSLINSHRRTPFIVGSDDPNSLSRAIELHCANGDSYLLHYQYYSGFSFHPRHAGEDDYRSILTYFKAGEGGKKAWKMDYDFDAALKEWLAGCAAPNFGALAANQVYTAGERTYESPLGNFSLAEQSNALHYIVDESGRLFSMREYTETADRTELGTLRELILTKDNFDNMFHSSGDGWRHNQSASEIRRNTAKAWSVVYQQNNLYYILQQSNGDLYLACGYYDHAEKDDPASDDSNIRQLFRLEREHQN